MIRHIILDFIDIAFLHIACSIVEEMIQLLFAFVVHVHAQFDGEDSDAAFFVGLLFLWDLVVWVFKVVVVVRV